MAMHILQLGPYPPPEGGISRNMLAIRDEAIAAGHKCSIIATSKSSTESNDANVYHPRSAFALLKLLAAVKFDVLHLHIGGDVSPRVLLLAAAAAIFGRGKSVLTLHSGAYPHTKQAVAAKPFSIRGFLFRRFGRIISVNEQLSDVFRRYGVADYRIKIILPYSLKMPNEKVVVPSHLAEFCAKHSPVLLAVGGLEKEYDPLFQIDAMRGVLKEFPSAGLMVVGDGSLQNEVEKTVAACGYAQSICIAGNVEHAVTLHMIRAADIFLRTTLFDGDAISVREALFLGTPVVATDNGMRPAGVDLIPIGDAQGLLNAVRKLAVEKKKPVVEIGHGKGNMDAVLSLYQGLSAE
jgi:glycogen synthase